MNHRTSLVLKIGLAIVVVGGIFLLVFDQVQKRQPSTGNKQSEDVLVVRAEDGSLRLSPAGQQVSMGVPKDWKVQEETGTTESGPSAGYEYRYELFDQYHADLFTCISDSSVRNGKQDQEKEGACSELIKNADPALIEFYGGPSYYRSIELRIIQGTINSPLRDWLLKTYKLPDTELANFDPGSEIEVGGRKGYWISLGCCAGTDGRFVFEHNRQVYMVGTKSRELYYNDEMKEVHPIVEEAVRSILFKN